MAIDRKQVLEDTRRIEELSRAAILTAVPLKTEAAQLGCALMALIVDGYSAVGELLGTSGEYHAPTIVRTMLEAFADLLSLAKDDGYEQRMRLRAAIGRKNVLDGYKTAYGGKPEFEATAKRVEADLAGIEQEIKRLRDAGATDYKVWQRFESAGLKGETAYVYGELSSFAHADYIAIMQRHFKREEIVLGAPLPDEWFAKVVFLSSTMLLDGLLKLPSFAICDTDKLDALRDEAITHHRRLPLVDKIRA